MGVCTREGGAGSGHAHHEGGEERKRPGTKGLTHFFSASKTTAGFEYIDSRKAEVCSAVYSKTIVRKCERWYFREGNFNFTYKIMELILGVEKILFPI